MRGVWSGRTVRQLSSCGGRMKDSGPPSDSHIKCLGMFQTNIPGHVMVSWADAELQTVSTALFSFHTIFLHHAMRSVTQSIRTSTFVYSALLLRSPTEVHLVFVIELAQTSFIFFPCFLFLFRIFYTGSGPEVTTDWQPVGSGGSVAENPPLRILWTGSNWGHHRRVG